MSRNNIEAWEIFMKLCEEFPELYEKYVEKIERELKTDMPDIKITASDREQAWKKIQEKIREDTEEP